MGNIAPAINSTMNRVAGELQKKELETVQRGEAWHTLMQQISDSIRGAAMLAESESSVSFILDHNLVRVSDQILLPAGYSGYQPDRERNVKFAEMDDDNTKFHAIGKNGRIDSKYSNVIIEDKKPAAYRTPADMEKAEKKAIKYLRALHMEEPGEYLAIVTDGIHCQFIEWFDEEAHAEPVGSLDGPALDRLIKAILKLSVKSLNAENLIKDLVGEQGNGGSLIHAMTNAIYKSSLNMCGKTRIAYSGWLDNFGLSHDDASQQQAIEARRRDLAAIIGKNEIEADTEYKILFSLQTATAVVAMLIAYKLVSVVKGNKAEYSLRNLYGQEPRFLRIELNRIANGAVASQIHIYNLLELNCFAWVFLDEQWNEEIYGVINHVISVLLRYENMPDLTDKTDDLFRDLYMAIMPASVRHSMGEYYTPAWLADNVISESLKYLPLDRRKHLRVLDSAAGSGTFPQRVIAMKRKKYSGLSNDEQLKYILRVCLVSFKE